MRTHSLSRSAMLAVVVALVALLAFPSFAFAATPSTVTGVKVYASSNPATAVIKWSAARYATSYRVYRAPYGTTTWTKIASTTSRSYSIPTAAGTRYSYKIRAYSSRYRRYGGYSSVVTPQPAALAGLSGDSVTGELFWAESEGAARYRISVTIGRDEPLVRYATEPYADFASLMPLFAAPGVSFEIAPVSAAGVLGVPAVWVGGTEGGGDVTAPIVGQGPVLSFMSGDAAGTYVLVIRDADTATDYTVLADAASMLDTIDGDPLTLDAFLDALDLDPTLEVLWEIETDATKTAGTEATHYLAAATVLPPAE